MVYHERSTDITLPLSLEAWFEGLTPLSVMDLRMNITGIRHSRHMIEDEFDNYEPESEEFDCLIEIHTRLVELSLRLTS